MSLFLQSILSTFFFGRFLVLPNPIVFPDTLTEIPPKPEENVEDIVIFKVVRILMQAATDIHRGRLPQKSWSTCKCHHVKIGN